MAVALKEKYQRVLDEQKQEVRELVMAGLEQINELVESLAKYLPGNIQKKVIYGEMKND